MLDVTVSTNAAAVSVRYDKAPTLVGTTIVRVLRRIGAGLVRYIAREKLSGQTLTPRTGTLRRALFWKIFVAERDAVLVVGADAKKAAYAGVQEFGGTIKPVRAKHLAIPLEAARTAKGVARMTAREFMARPEQLGFEHAFVNKRRTAIMGVRRSRGGRVAEPVFALKTSVTIPARSYVRAGVAERRDWILGELGLGTQEAIRAALEGDTKPSTGGQGD